MHRLRSGGFHRRLSAPLGFVAIAVATLMLTAGPAAAYPQYRTTTTVNVRSGPGTGYSVTGSLPSGSTFNLICQVQNGTSVGGNRTWDMIATSGPWRFISDYYTTTPSFNNYAPNTPDCSKL